MNQHAAMREIVEDSQLYCYVDDHTHKILYTRQDAIYVRLEAMYSMLSVPRLYSENQRDFSEHSLESTLYSKASL
jgi:hypothetical protein